MDWVETFCTCGAGNFTHAAETQITAMKIIANRNLGTLHLLIHINIQILRTGIDSFVNIMKHINANYPAPTFSSGIKSLYCKMTARYLGRSLSLIFSPLAK